MKLDEIPPGVERLLAQFEDSAYALAAQRAQFANTDFAPQPMNEVDEDYLNDLAAGPSASEALLAAAARVYRRATTWREIVEGHLSRPPEIDALIRLGVRFIFRAEQPTARASAAPPGLRPGQDTAAPGVWWVGPAR